MRPLLVTGASGFLGWHVAQLLIERGYKVRVLARRLPSVADLEAEAVIGDLREPDSLRSAVQGCAAVFHVAADYRLWARDSRQLYQSNVEGTRNLLAAARAAGAERFVYTSTVGCIGFVENGIGDESTPVSLEAMSGAYKRSKFLAEQEALRAASEGFPVVIVNPTAPVGARDIKPTPTGQTIVDFLRGKMPAFIDSGLNVVDARETAHGHLLAFEKGQPGRRYILGSENLTLQQIFQTLARISGKPAPTARIPWPLAFLAGLISTGAAAITGKPPRVPIDAVRMARKKMWVSHERAVRELGFRPSGAEFALQNAVTWFEAHGYC